MSQISYEEVNLMVRLYDLRREPRLREARAWFVDHFHAGTPEEVMQKYPQGSQENTYIRMVISYWEMVAGIVNRGLINDELFFESNGEVWVVWDRMRTIVPTWRAAFKNPTLFSGIEETCKRLEAWRERRAPGSSVAALVQCHQKFLTPVTPHHVVGPDRIMQAPRDFAQHIVSSGVAILVVDGLKVIDVAHHHRCAASFPARAHDFVCHQLHDHAAVP